MFQEKTGGCAMAGQEKETGEKRPFATTILYGIAGIVAVAGAGVLIARYAFNVDLLNSDAILGSFIRRR
jgi:hypothetical protein